MAKIETAEIYADVNRRILDALANGRAPWQRPWVGGGNAPRNLQSGKPYRGVNALLLSLTDYRDPRWTTAPAAFKLDGHIRKGERSTLVTLWKRIRVKDADAPEGVKTIAILRYFRVFNVEQIDWPEDAIPTFEPAGMPDEWEPVAEAERVLADYLATSDAPTMAYGGTSAHYRPADHHLQLPEPGTFRSADGFYGVAFHECAHSTAPKLGRELSTSFGSDPYAREELTAEMASAFVCAAIDVDGGFDNSAAYLRGWRDRIANDPKLIVQAAGRAQKASDVILGQVVEYTDETPQTAAHAATV